MKDIIKKLAEKKSINCDEAALAMTHIMSGEASEAFIAAFIMGIRINGETPEIIASCAEIMRTHATPIVCNDPNAIDIVGTGGDCSNTFNISTTAAFVIAGAGVTVAKHGSYGVSSLCGSANVLDQLGINLNYSPDMMCRALNTIGIAFLFAPNLHPAMKYVVGTRRELGIWSLFNILGPICNPANISRGLIGVFKSDLLSIVAEACKKMNGKHQLIVNGMDGLDEITTTSSSMIVELKEDDIISMEFNPSEWNIPLATKEDLIGGNPEQNAKITRNILSGELHGPKRDIVMINAAFTIYSAGIVDNPRDGLELAKESIDSGKALKKLEELAQLSNG